MNQAERTRPIWARTCTLGNASNFSRFQTIASLQLRKLGRAGVEADIAVWWPLTLRISSERYVVRPRQSGESAASPKLAAPAWRMPPRSGLKYTKIPAVGVEGSVASFQLGCGGNSPPGRRLSQLAAARERGPPAARKVGVTAAVRLRCGPPRAFAACPLRPSGGNADRSVDKAPIQLTRAPFP